MPSSISELLWQWSPVRIPVRILLWLTAKLFGWYFLTVPRFVRKWVPHSSSSLSIAFLYIFAQALALMWLLVVNLCSVCSVLIVKHIQYHLSGEELDFVVAGQTLLTGYVRYCILRVLFFIGTSFYTIGWEAFADFPTVRRLVAGSRSKNVADVSTTVASTNGGHANLPLGRRSKSRSASCMVDTDGSPSGTDVVASWMQKDIQDGRDTSEDDWNSSPLREDSSPKGIMPRMVSEDSSHNGENVAEDPDIALHQVSSQRRRKRKQFFREATLLAPLLGLIACTWAMVVLTVACQVKRLRIGSCVDSVLISSMADPTGRVNRGIRFALFVAFLQWVQQFFYLFPSWHQGLQATTFGKAWSLVSVPLWPIALSRFCQWSFVPAGTGVTHYLSLYGPHHLFDMGLMIVLQMWWSGACICVLKRPEISGLDRKRRFFEEEDWSEMAVLFKYSFLIPTMLHFCRGCVKFGFVDAQNDLLVIVCAYPLLLVTVWTIVWAVVVAPGKRLLLAGAVGSLSLASSICSAADSAQAGATVVVWLHLMRQYLKLFKNTNKKKHPARARANSANLESTTLRQTSGADSSRSRVTTRETSETEKLPQDHPPERRFAWFILVISALIAVTFFGTLVSLSAVSGVQQKIDWYPSTIWFEREEDPPTLRVDHTISRLRLQLARPQSELEHTSPAENRSHVAAKAAGVSYGVCSHAWHGLSVLDYALLSLASYFDQADPSLRHLLEGIFPGESGIRWQFRNYTSQCRTPATSSTDCTRSGSRLSWIEVEIDDPQLELPILVLALRGTDPFRVSDYVEDIRMWTEPVALSILSTVFPTVRAWPRKTVEMIILGIHDFLFSLGLPSDTWSYSELVDCISRIPREQYSQIVLTGHSLGGGMATVVAALTHLPVVGITPPGIYWSIAKHQRGSGGVDKASAGDDMSNWMHHQSLTLLVENDWVNGIFDDHGGLVQMMTCDRSKESLELACHMLEGTICHIFDRCGDPRHRFDSCAHEYVLKDTLQSKTVEVLREVMPSNIENLFSDLWEAIPYTLPIGSRMFSNTVVLLLLFFVAMPLLGGVIEEIFLL